MMNPSKARPSTALLFDEVIRLLKLKSDRALAQRLGHSAPTISKMRSGRNPLSSETIISIHEETQLPIYAIRLLAGLPKLREPDKNLCSFIENSPNYELIRSAGFCFCIETTKEYQWLGKFYPSLIEDDYHLVAIAQCTGYRPTAGGFYPATDYELEEMKQLGIEASAMHWLDGPHFYDPDYIVETMNDLDAVTAQMIAECPRFYAIKAEHEGDMIAAMIAQRPAQQTTKPQRGRL